MNNQEKIEFYRNKSIPKANRKINKRSFDAVLGAFQDGFDGTMGLHMVACALAHLRNIRFEVVMYELYDAYDTNNPGYGIEVDDVKRLIEDCSD